SPRDRRPDAGDEERRRQISLRSSPPCDLSRSPLARKGSGSDRCFGRKGPDVTGVSPGKRRDLTGVSSVNPAKTPPETPPPHARAADTPRTPEPATPPAPLTGGSNPDWVSIEETHVSDRGRRRPRSVRVDLTELRRGLLSPTVNDQNDWQQIRRQLQL